MSHGPVGPVPMPPPVELPPEPVVPPEAVLPPEPVVPALPPEPVVPPLPVVPPEAVEPPDPVEPPLVQHLKQAGIGSAIHYPVPLHLQRAYVSLNYSAGEFPVTESAAAEIVSLPVFPQLTLEQQEKIAAEVIAFATRSRETAEPTASLVSAQTIA